MDIGIEANFSFFRSNAGDTYVAALFEFDADSIIWNGNSASLQVFYNVVDAIGTVIGYDERSVEVERGPAGSPTILEMPMQMAPGAYSIYAGILDPATQVHGTFMQEIESPNFGSGEFMLSSLARFSDGSRVEDFTPEPGRALLVGGFHFTPRVSPVYAPGGDLRLVFNAYGYDASRPAESDLAGHLQEGRQAIPALQPDAVQPGLRRPCDRHRGRSAREAIRRRPARGLRGRRLHRRNHREGHGRRRVDHGSRRVPGIRILIPPTPATSGRMQGKLARLRKAATGILVVAAAVVFVDRGWELIVPAGPAGPAGADGATLDGATLDGATLLVAAGATGGSGPEAGTVLQESIYQALEVFSGALMLIRDQYLEPVDPEFLMDGAVRGIFEALDPDSAYLSAADLARYRNRASASASVGIGLQKRYYLHVDDVLPGSPAAAAGIERGAAITTIDGQNTRELRIPVALLLLSGEPGTSLELTIRDATDSESRAITLQRAVLPAPPVEHRMLGDGIGLIQIRRFHEKTPAQLAAALEALEVSGADSLAIDVRGSRGSGGGCEAGVEVAGAFMEGAVAQRVERTAEGEESSAPLETPAAEPLFDGPLAVIVNRSTVCPGEVLAAALKSRAEADVVGRRTAGRTGRPELIELPEGDAILLSTAHIRGTDGEDILGVGVVPSVGPAELEIEPEDLDDEDPELDLAIRALKRRRAAGNAPAC